MYFEKLKENEIDTALHIADECVGKNLYSYEDFSKAVKDDNRFFFFLKSEEGKIAGYIYFLITSSFDIVSSVNIDADAIAFQNTADEFSPLPFVKSSEETDLLAK